MTARDIEAQTLRVLGRLAANQPNEDSLIELKAQWPAEMNRTARQLAGHANAARGEPVLWIIGADQQAGIVGARFEELANWWPRIQAEFDGPSPSLTEVNVDWNGVTVVAMLFETERAPFVVRNATFGQQGGGPVQFEVPWREGAATRTARHNDLLRLLFPLSKVPFSEINSAAVTLVRQLELQWEHRWLLDCKVFVSPAIGERVVLLNNRLAGWIDAAQINPHLDLTGWNIISVYGNDAAVFEGGVSFASPAVIRVRAESTTPEIDPGRGDIVIHLNVLPVGAEKPIVVENTLSACERPMNAAHVWATDETRRPWDQPHLPVLHA